MIAALYIMANLCSSDDTPRSKCYLWGQSGNDQLALEPNDDGYVSEPTHHPGLGRYVVTASALGPSHSLLLTNSGLLSFGNNDHGQLGRQGDSRKPELLGDLRRVRVTAIAVGEHHSLALDDNGILYSWGSNECGQCGRPKQSGYNIPHKVDFPTPSYITQISCGEYHCIALAKDGAIYTWGSNVYGQLGHGLIKSSTIETPKCLDSIRPLNFVKIASGGSHSFALTVSGALFGWGRNSNGQLGLGTANDSPFPVCCRQLRQLKVKHVSCGLNHTAALTKDGGVFTFGAGTLGQLGHNIKQDEHLPKKVLELMGSTVTQVSCGRNHTLALVPSSGRVYSFGLGAYGQLGLCDTNNRASPCSIKSPWTTSNGVSRPVTYTVRFITAGANSCMIYLEDKNNPSTEEIDHRDIPDKQVKLSAATIQEIISCNPSTTQLTSELERTLKALFVYPSIWNGAFLNEGDDHYGCSSADHGVNLDLAKEELSKLQRINNGILCQLVESCTEKALLPSMKCAIPDVEALRAFLIVPFIPLFNNPTNYATVHSQYGNAMLTMDEKAANVLDKWLLHIPRRHFRHFMFLFKKSVTHILTMNSATTEYEALVRQRGMQIGLDVLKRIYAINEKEGQEEKVNHADFYIPEISEHVDIKTDYYNWYHKTHITRQGAPLLSFCNYAFVFDAQAKTVLLHTDALIQMQQAIDQAHRLNLINILSSAEIDPIHPCLVITVSRDNLVHDTLHSLNMHGSADLKKPLKVQFKNEEAVDEGGVRKEFFILILREVLDLKYGMFQHYDESRLLWFNALTFEDDMAMFHLIGILCGLAIYNGTIIDLPFPLALYKKLLNKPVNLDDLRELDPQLGKSLQDLLDYDSEDVADVFCLSFSVSLNVFGEITARDLIPNGSNITVTHDNKVEYVNHYISYIFNTSVEKMFTAFHDGFHKVCGSKVLSFFHPLELQAMVVGNEAYDWEELEKNCEYKGEFYRLHQTIEYFWEAFNELSHTQRKQFLRFLTGCDRIPIQGMKSLKMIIQPVQVSEEYLPVAHTCFNLLDLPVRYTSKQILSNKLNIAIDNAEGFGLV